MAGKLPYVTRPGIIDKIIGKLIEAKTPDRFTYDFLETKLGCKGGNYKQFVSLAKKLNLLKSDGTPTELYTKIRNSQTSGAAMAKAIKKGYTELFERNEYANELDEEKLKGLIIEITGLEKKNQIVNLTCKTFLTLKKYADFDKQLSKAEEKSTKKTPISDSLPPQISSEDLNLNLAYTINIVLPKTDDPAVFNAIFRALKENLLRK